MNTEVAIHNGIGFDISKFNDMDLNLLQQQIFAKQMSDFKARFEAKMTEFEDAQKKNEQLLDIKTKELDNKIKDVEEIAINQAKVTNSRWEYGSQSDFGIKYRVSIGAKMVGRLFKVIGLAQKSRSDTRPYRDKIPKYAVVETYEKYESFKWDIKNCMEYLDNWLKDNGYYVRFYSIETTKEMKNFITELCEKYSVY